MRADWSRSLLFITSIGTVALLADAALDGWRPFPLAAAALFLAVGLIAAATRKARKAETPIAVASGPASSLPPAARNVLEALHEPLILLDGSGRVMLANVSAAAIVGPDPERKHISAVLRTPELLEAIERVLAGGEAEDVGFSFVVPLERHYRAYVVATKMREGAPLLVVQLHDLTAIRRAEEMRVDFIANASHELRTPLAAVSGFIDTLRGHAKDDATARERFLGIMAVEAARMRRLIDDLLSLTRIELNEHNPPSGTVDLRQIVRDAAAALSPLAQADSITIRTEGDTPLRVTGDRDELIQVFQNLIHNAIKYGHEGSTVTIRFGTLPPARRGGPEQVFAAVQDEGDGLAREIIPRLTERCYRVDVKRSRERGGTGLGLAIVKHILNRHHGRLQIESTLGVGSIFTVHLPAAVEASAMDPGVTKMS